jgi:hypothetical protein
MEAASASDRAHTPTRSRGCMRAPTTPALAKSAAAAFDHHEKRMTLTRSVFTQRAEIKILH